MKAFPQVGVDYCLRHILQRFQKVNTPGVCVPLWDQDYDRPPYIPQYIPILPHELSDLHQILSPLQPGGVGSPLRRIFLPDPFLKILHAALCVPSCLVKL